MSICILLWSFKQSAWKQQIGCVVYLHWMFNQVSVLRNMLMFVCSRSYINMSKSDLSVRSDIIVSVGLDMNVKNHVDVI